jgi:hypothetical protein
MLMGFERDFESINYIQPIREEPRPKAWLFCYTVTKWMQMG